MWHLLLLVNITHNRLPRHLPVAEGYLGGEVLLDLCVWTGGPVLRAPEKQVPGTNGDRTPTCLWLTKLNWPKMKKYHNIRTKDNYANPVYGVATTCRQVRWLRWGHPSLFHTATSLLIWYKMFCVRDISYRFIWMEFINMFSVYAQSGTHSRFNWKIIVVLTYNPSVLMCVEITDAPKL